MTYLQRDRQSQRSDFDFSQPEEPEDQLDLRRTCDERPPHPGRPTRPRRQFLHFEGGRKLPADRSTNDAKERSCCLTRII